MFVVFSDVSSFWTGLLFGFWGFMFGGWGYEILLDAADSENKWKMKMSNSNGFGCLVEGRLGSSTF